MALIGKPARRLKNGAYVCGECGLTHPTGNQAIACCADTIDPSGNSGKFQVGGDHYTKQAIQPWDIVDTWPHAERVAYYRGNALKYLMRLNDKDSPETNARKAEHYCAKLAETLEGK